MLARGLFALGLAALAGPALAEDADAFEFFEKRIRPLLAAKCFACHGSETAAMGDLRMDSRDALLRGGSRGAAIQPGDPAASLLLKAVSYASLELRMPPDGKLPEREIADLEAWIRMGAPDPRSAVAPPPAQEEIDLAEGRHFWSFRPVAAPAPPRTDEGTWARTPVDQFLLARMDADGLRPAPEADRRTLIRRATFDLTGLPPTPAEVAAFLDDTGSDAYERLVERLLASPHYGERWGRHWLDLVRWAETNGHEFDNNKLDAWRYRDYVIEAFNADLPYDRFLREQLAGDLLPPRLSADGTHFINPVASGMYWLWEVLNSPTDSVKARADQIDNQIDVLSKTTQGLTVACARCHDHKFDPIPTADYYSLFGILNSTHMSEICIDSPDTERRIQALHESVAGLNREIERLLQPALARSADQLAARLVAASGEVEATEAEGMAAELRYALAEPSHPLYPFAQAAQASAETQDFEDWLQCLRDELAAWAAKADREHPLWSRRGDEIYEDFEQGYGDWIATGAAFGTGPTRVARPGQELAGHAGQALAASFGGGADALVGTLTTEKFRMPARYVHVRMAGPEYSRALRENASIRFTVIADEHKSGHAMPDGSGRLQWHTIAMTKERGRICSIEIIDRDRNGAVAVDQIVFSDSPKPPPIAGRLDPRVQALANDASIRSLADLAAAYQALAKQLAGLPVRSPSDEALLANLLGLRNLEDAAAYLDPAEIGALNELAARRQRINEEIPASSFAMSSWDWRPADSPIHIRGNHKNPGDIAPRQFLQVIAGTEQVPFRHGSGRLELAKRIASAENPLTARVMANRVWRHHFGQGIVATPDNFGVMGARPTHPELLDHLASRFMAADWSIKALHRAIMLSSAYRMRSDASAQAGERDPSNRLLSHFPVRRLEAEAIRDSMLAVAGSLDPALGGPSVPPHISAYQAGRGKPESGPLDGRGRRSVYLQVRRNFLPPLFLAFDYPLPISTAGRRGVSAVASQALLMLNNDFVNGQAATWAARTLDGGGRRSDRIRTMYLEAYGRPPRDWEISEIERFLAAQSERRAVPGPDDPGVWADLAHAMLNTAEFLFVR